MPYFKALVSTQGTSGTHNVVCSSSMLHVYACHVTLSKNESQRLVTASHPKSTISHDVDYFIAFATFSLTS